MTSAAKGVVLLTGASGFVGRAAATALEQAGWEVRKAGHQNADRGMFGIALAPDSDWSKAVRSCSAVVHLAARTHILREESDDPLAAFRHVNTGGSTALARAAAKAGVRRFLFVSSISVNGPMRSGPLTEADSRPETPYGISKLEAERALQELALETGMEVTILRPPLVYGPHVKARFLQLLSWCHRGYPLPLGAVRNRRSLIGVENLSDAIVAALSHPHAGNRTYLVSDGEDISTPNLILMLGREMKRSPRLFPVDARVLRVLAAAIGKSSEIERLVGSLIVDSSRFRQDLSWNPPISVAAGMARTARWYVEERRHRP